MRRPAAALALCIALAGSLVACGGDEESTDVVPKSTPDLVAPANASLGAATTRDDATGTTGTTTTGTTQTTATQPQGTATQTPAAPTQTQAQTQAPEGTGGAGATTQTTPPAGTTTGNSGGFSDFCEQNPGACPE